MKKTAIVCSFILIFLSGFTQTRYLDSLFEVTKHADIEYGQNYDNKDSLWHLLMDVYEPTGDTAALRPIIYFVHGGSFISDSRTDQSINKTAEFFTQKGYVTANIQYRVERSDFDFIYLNFLDKNNWYRAIIRATQDLKAAVRYIKKDVATKGNLYKVDTTKIFIYGSSAGAITALHTVYLDDTVEMENSPFKKNYALLGGLDGNSGSPGYTISGIKAVVSCSGAIEKLDYINNNTDIAYLGFHKTIDPVVPFDLGCFDVVACWLGKFNGANKIYPRTVSLGMNSEFYPVEGIGHPVDAVDDTATHRMILQKTTNFLYRILNPDIATGLHSNTIKNIDVYPNPSDGRFVINVPEELKLENIHLTVYTIDGVVAYTSSFSQKERIEFNWSLPAGIYTILMTGNSKTYLAKITIVK